MNKKILVGIAVAVIIVAAGVIGAKAMLGDKATELPGEEKIEKSLNIQEGKGNSEASESGENEANENEP